MMQETSAGMGGLLNSVVGGTTPRTSGSIAIDPTKTWKENRELLIRLVKTFIAPQLREELEEGFKSLAVVQDQNRFDCHVEAAFVDAQILTRTPVATIGVFLDFVSQRIAEVESNEAGFIELTCYRALLRKISKTEKLADHHRAAARLETAAYLRAGNVGNSMQCSQDQESLVNLFGKVIRIGFLL